MARIFLSHSSRDNAAAAELKAWLDEQGFAPAFLDFDKHSGIPAGADWERTLYEQIQRCQALLIMQTPNWSASRWCFAEFTQARALGKPIFQVVESDEAAAEKPIAVDLQRLDLRHDRPAGLEQLRRELERIALQDQDGFPWPPPSDPRRPPFPGLMVFEAEDAAVYFGRDNDWKNVIERLNTRRVQGGAQLLVIQGSSGSGKSSLLRAGVLPRLRRAGRQWLVLPVLRPQARPLESLAQTLALALQRPEAWRELHQQLLTTTAAPALTGLVAGWAADLRLAAAAPEAQLLLPIDQAEELFTVAEAAERDRFVAVLAAVLQPPRPVQAVMTIRADAMGSLQSLPELVNNLDPLPLGPLSLERYRAIIEGPARVAGLRVEPAFVERAIHDTGTEDALPLLAFALRRIHDLHGADGVLSLSDYQSLEDPVAGLSPLENAVKQAADGVLQIQRPDEASLQALREAFVPVMVRLSEQGGYARRAAVWDSLPQAARPLLEALVDARLLVRRQVEGQLSTVEVAHEALLRVWPLLRGWLDESRDFLLGCQQLEQDLAQWQAASPADKPRALLSGLKLAKAEIWLAERERQLRPDIRDFILASKRRSIQQRRLLTYSIVAAFALVSGAASVALVQLQKVQSAQSAHFASTHKALVSIDPYLSLLYGLAAAKPLLDGRKPWEAAQLSQSMLQALKSNRESAMPIQTRHYWVNHVVELSNGDLITGGRDGFLRHWRAGSLLREWNASKADQLHPAEVTGLISLGNGEIGSSDALGNSYRWRDGRMVGDLTDVKQHFVEQFSSYNENRTVVTRSDQGDLIQWKDGRVIDIHNTGQDKDVEIRKILRLKNGMKLSAASDGSLVIWRSGSTANKLFNSGLGSRYGHRFLKDVSELDNGKIVVAGGEFLPSGQGSKGELMICNILAEPKACTEAGAKQDTFQMGFQAVVPLKGGNFATGDDASNIKFWIDNNPQNPYLVIPTGQDGISELLVLRNGDLLSIGYDGTIRRWHATPKQPSRVVIPVQKSKIAAFTSLADGSIAVADDNGVIRIWRDGIHLRPEIRTGRHVAALAQLKNGDLAIAGSGYLAYLRNGKIITPQVAKRAGEEAGFGDIRNITATPKGDLLVISWQGRISRWRDWVYVGLIAMSSDYGTILSAVELEDGELIGATESGMAQRWKNGHRIGSEFSIVKGTVYGPQDDMFLIPLHNNKWISSTSGQRTTGNSKLSYWEKSISSGDLPYLETGIGDERIGGITGIQLSRAGEFLIGTRSDIQIISLARVSRDACASLRLPLTSEKPGLDLALRNAQSTCEDLNHKTL